jgi:O-acetyl-ADP-ribose deacetylase
MLQERAHLAVLSGVKSIAFPAISTGAYGFPIARAARIGVRTVRDFICVHPDIETVHLVCHGSDAFRTFSLGLDEDRNLHP